MRTVRRIYFYLVTFISLQVILWGAINLIYSFVRTNPSTDFEDILAQGLAQIIVGVPIFIFHWLIIRRDANTDPEERDSAIRALFFYAIRLTTLIIAVIHVYSLLQGFLFRWMGIAQIQRQFFPDNDFAKNLITIAANLLVWLVFERQLRAAWQPVEAQQDFELLKDFRRLFDYVWSTFNLLFLIVALSNILFYVFEIHRGINENAVVDFLNGLAVIVISGPFWVLSERYLTATLLNKENEQSIIRKIFTYIVLFILIATSLISLGYVLKGIFLVFFGEIFTWVDYIQSRQNELAIALVCVLFWRYFYLKLKQVFTDAGSEEERARLTRLYAYVLSLAGSAMTYAGGWFLLQTIALQMTGVLNNWKDDLSTAIMLLLLGLPLWLLHWHPMQKQASADTLQGENNRRSVIRKIYLYLIVFASVIGVMALSAALVYRNLNQLFGNMQQDLGYHNLNNLFRIILTTGWLWMHLRQLRLDGKWAALAQQNRYKTFPVMVVQAHPDKTGSQLFDLFKKHAPLIPVTPISIDQLNALEGERIPKLLIFSAADYQQASQEAKTWLERYPGKILLLPLPYQNIVWAGLETTQERKLLERVVRQSIKFAEGEQETLTARNNAWVILGYILAGLILLWFVFGIGMNFLFG